MHTCHGKGNLVRRAFAPWAATRENAGHDPTADDSAFMKLFIAIATLVVAALVAPLFFTPDGADMSKRMAYLPWNIETRADGNSTAMGLTLNISTLAQAREVFGPDMDVAIVTAPNESGSVEAYIASAKAGYITGRLVLVADASQETVTGMQARAKKVEYMESTTRKTTPTQADLATILTMPIKSIVFIPTVNLDRAAVVERFGEPAREIRTNDQQTHLLFPDKGLDILIDTKAKEVFQYVAPKDFAVVSAPLASEPSAAAH